MRRFSVLILVVATAGLLAAVAIVPGCGRALRPAETRELLKQIRTAWATTNVSGRLVTTVRLHDQALTAEASVQRGQDVSFTKFLTGRYRGWQVVEQDDRVWRVDPQGQAKPGQARGSSARLRALLRADNLTVRRVPVFRRVAGRPISRYVFHPPGGTKARVVLDLDAQTHFPLATARYSTSGKMISSTVFRQVSFGGPPPARVPVPQVAGPRPSAGQFGRRERASEEQLAKVLGGPLLKPTYVPTGFELAGTYLHRTRRSPVAELRYSDGVRVVVLAQLRVDGGRSGEKATFPDRGARAQRRPLQRPRRRDGRDRPGARARSDTRGRGRRQALRSRLRGHMLRERRGNRLVVLAGDLPAEELQRIMASIPGGPPQTSPQPGANSLHF